MKKTFLAMMMSVLMMMSVFMFGSMDSFAAGDPWADWRFLIGEWTAEGSGVPGDGQGEFSFQLDLQGSVLLRRSRVNYPAHNGRPAFVHEDLLVIHPGPSGFRAEYFDSEGHAIRYQASFSDDRSILVFLSDPNPGAPRFRLTYFKGADGSLKIRFETAPPSTPDQFTVHVEGTARRKRS